MRTKLGFLAATCSVLAIAGALGGSYLLGQRSRDREVTNLQYATVRATSRIVMLAERLNNPRKVALDHAASLALSANSYGGERTPGGFSPDPVAVWDYPRLSIAALRAGHYAGYPLSRNDWITPRDPGRPAAVTIPLPVHSYCAVSRFGAWYAYYLSSTQTGFATRDPTRVCLPFDPRLAESIVSPH